MRRRERESYKKRKSINNSFWVYFPTQKQIIKILEEANHAGEIRARKMFGVNKNIDKNDNDKNSVPGQPQVARTHPKRSASRKPQKHHRHSAWTGLSSHTKLPTVRRLGVRYERPSDLESRQHHKEELNHPPICPRTTDRPHPEPPPTSRPNDLPTRIDFLSLL